MVFLIYMQEFPLFRLIYKKEEKTFALEKLNITDINNLIVLGVIRE